MHNTNEMYILRFFPDDLNRYELVHDQLDPDTGSGTGDHES